MRRITLKPEDEIFLCPTEGRAKAFAHVGIVNHTLVVVNDPYRAYRGRNYVAPFKYGNSITTLPLREENVGADFDVECYGLKQVRMFDVVAIDRAERTFTIDIQDSVIVEPRLPTDAPISDGLKTD
jgi:hypothetical protein